MPWQQTLDPLDSIWLSALLAVIPLAAFTVGLSVFKLSGVVAGGIGLVLEAIIALVVYRMPVASVSGAALLGALNGLWPICYIVVTAVWLYKLTHASGKLDDIRTSIASISTDSAVQVLLLAFAFGAFLEGIAGFGIPIAICAALLTQVGFAPIRAACISLVANFAAGAYGAIGVPVLVGAQVAGISSADLSRTLALVLEPITLFVPALLVVMVSGWSGLRIRWRVTTVTSVVFAGVQAATLLFLGPELAAVLPGLAAMGAVMLVTRAERTTPDTVSALPMPRIAAAWSPYWVLTALVVLWSTPWFRQSVATGPFAGWHLALSIPGVTNALTSSDGSLVTTQYSWAPIEATGTAILVAVLITALASRSVGWRLLGGTLATTIRELWRPLLLILLVLALANIANLSGATGSIAHALAATGAVFPLIAPVIGWFGVFLTGSVVNNNTLFAKLQTTSATGIGVDPVPLVAANTAGGAAGKVISPQSIAIAAGATGLTGREGAILRASLLYSLGILAAVCVWTFVVATYLPSS